MLKDDMRGADHSRLTHLRRPWRVRSFTQSSVHAQWQSSLLFVCVEMRWTCASLMIPSRFSGWTESLYSLSMEKERQVVRNGRAKKKETENRKKWSCGESNAG